MKYIKTFKIRMADKLIFTTFLLSTTLAISGMHHGFFEILQGNTPTTGMFIDSIGEKQKTWEYGGDGAFTLIPNFMVSGILSILVSLFIIYWSAVKVHNNKTVNILFVLFFLLTLVGGGIGHIPFFLLVWLYSRNYSSKISWVKRKISTKTQLFFSKIWLPVTVISSLLFLIGLEISVFGYFPGETNPETILKICWGALFSSLALINVSFLSAFCKEANK